MSNRNVTVSTSNIASIANSTEQLKCQTCFTEIANFFLQQQMFGSKSRTQIELQHFVPAYA